MHYLIYKTTNDVNGKFYIGSHKTKNINDGYLGSGTILRSAILKYGKHNFTKEVMFIFDNSEDMFKKERELVSPDFLCDQNVYNLKVGGFGGYDFINKNNLNPSVLNGAKHLTKEDRQRGAAIVHSRFQNDADFRKSYSEKHRLKAYKYNFPKAFLGKSHSDETKSMIGSKASIYQKGHLNSQYGTRWIVTDGQKPRKLKRDEVIPDGWRFGKK